MPVVIARRGAGALGFHGLHYKPWSAGAGGRGSRRRDGGCGRHRPQEDVRLAGVAEQHPEIPIYRGAKVLGGVPNSS